MGAVVLDHGIKPEQWAFDRELVGKKWDWFWDSDIRFVIPFWEGGGVPFNLIDSVGATIFSGTPTWGASEKGLVSEIDGTDGWQIAHSDRYNILDDITLIFAGVVDTGSAFQHFMGKHDQGGGPDTPFDFRTDDSATPLLTVIRGNVSAWPGFGWYDGPAITLGKFQVYGVTQEGDISVAPTFYIDGVATTGSTAGGTSPASEPATGNTEPLRFGRREDGAVQLDGRQSLIIGSARQWTAGQHAQFALDPFGPIRMSDEVVRSRVFVAAAAAAGTGALSLGALTIAAVGAMQPEGTSTPALADMALTAVGQVPFEGVGDLALVAMTLASTGVMQPEGTGLPTLEAMALAAQGVQEFLGVSTPNLEALVLAAQGTMQLEGTSTPDLETLALVAQGVQEFLGVSTPDLETMVLTSTGVMQPEGTGTLTLADVVLAAVGTAGAPEGVGDLALTIQELAAQGEMPTEGASILDLAIQEIVAQGHEDPDGTGAVILQNFVLAAAGAQAGVAQVFKMLLRPRRRPGQGRGK